MRSSRAREDIDRQKAAAAREAAKVKLSSKQNKEMQTFLTDAQKEINNTLKEKKNDSEKKATLVGIIASRFPQVSQKAISDTVDQSWFFTDDPDEMASQATELMRTMYANLVTSGKVYKDGLWQ
jgi:hypothetical protein